MKKVLIITHSKDNQGVNDVCQLLQEQGAEAVRLDTDLYPEHIGLSSGYSNGSWSYHLQRPNQETVDLAQIESIWYRRLRTGRSLQGQMEPELFKPTVEESRRTLLGVLHTLPVFCMDPYWLVRYTDNKQVQLEQAALSGLQIPQTLFSNSPEAVKDFYSHCKGQMIAKMQTAFGIMKDDEEHVVFTNLITEQDMEDIETLTTCPMVFQEAIPKQLELRATIVGNHVFTSAVNSQSTGKSDHDWRRDGDGLITDWEPHQLPNSVEESLLTLMDRLGLNYGAADFILTPEGEYVFLEVNPVGEYEWLDEHTDKSKGHPIARTMVNLLLHPEQGRQPGSQLMKAALIENM